MNTNKYRMIGTTDDVTTCDRCGKAELKGTVILEMLDAHGESEGVTYYGSTCGARALADRGVRVTAAKLRDQASAAQRERQRQAAYAAQSLAAYEVPVEGDYDITAAATLFVSRNSIAIRNNPGRYVDLHASVRNLIDGWRSQVVEVAA